MEYHQRLITTTYKISSKIILKGFGKRITDENQDSLVLPEGSVNSEAVGAKQVEANSNSGSGTELEPVEEDSNVEPEESL